ncbi:MAG: peptidylprolyl isomerase [Candidatus Sumerlaeaceae bacterium]|nr:peptidylprolyl isomerase [Candidatus Sumerlaeaceae bacterium]
MARDYKCLRAVVWPEFAGRFGIALLCSALAAPIEAAPAAKSSASSEPAKISKGVAQTTATVQQTKKNTNRRFEKLARYDLGSKGHFLLAVVKGKELREDGFSTYTALVDYLEGGGGSEKRQTELLQDWVMQYVVADVLPEVAKAATKTDVPLPYTTLYEVNVLKRALREKLESETSPTREQLEAWTKENAQRFTRPEEVHAYHIFMQVSDDVPTSRAEAVRKRMEEVKRLADEGTSFAQLARRYSEAASSRVGGDIGWVSRRMPIGPESKPMNLALENALFGLQRGEVSDIIQTSHGLHLMYCADRVTTYVPTTDELITSRILPRSAQVQLVREKWLNGIKATREKLGAQVLFDVEKGDGISTDVPVVKINNHTWSLRQLEELYGTRFTQAFRMRAQTTQTLASFLDEVVSELAGIYWALDEKVDQQPLVQRDLEWAGGRARLRKILTTYVAEKYPVTEDTLKKVYEERKNLMRLPEGRGYILSVKAEPTTVGMSRDEARAAAKKKAEEIRKKILEGADIEQLAREVSQDNRASSGGLVERSVLAHLNDPAGRMFGAVASWLKAGEVSDVRQFGDTFVVVKLVERWEGEAPPFDQVRGRLEATVRQENEQAARREILTKAVEKDLVLWANPAAQFGINPDAGF